MIHFDGNSSEYLSLSIEHSDGSWKGYLSNGNTPLLDVYCLISPDRSLIDNAKKFMAKLWILYGIKIANHKSAAYNNFFHAWWQMECQKRIQIDPPLYPSELDDVVYFDCGYIDMHTRTFCAPLSNATMPIELRLGHMPDYEKLVAMNRK